MGCVEVDPQLGADLLRLVESSSLVGSELDLERPCLELGHKICFLVGLWTASDLRALFRLEVLPLVRLVFRLRRRRWAPDDVLSVLHRLLGPTLFRFARLSLLPLGLVLPRDPLAKRAERSQDPGLAEQSPHAFG